MGDLRETENRERLRHYGNTLDKGVGFKGWLAQPQMRLGIRWCSGAATASITRVRCSRDTGIGGGPRDEVRRGEALGILLYNMQRAAHTHASNTRPHRLFAACSTRCEYHG